LGKIGFLKPCPGAQEIFWEKSDFSNHAQGAQEMKNKSGAQEIRCPRNPKDFLDLTRISFEIQWSGNFRFRVLEALADDEPAHEEHVLKLK
jgi:uncharacterized C2H2 Zn-finger protein